MHGIVAPDPPTIFGIAFAGLTASP
jgi:hypothetical protein